MFAMSSSMNLFALAKISFTQNISWLPIHLKMQQHAVLNLLKLDSLVQLDQWMQLMSAMKGFNSGSDNFISLQSCTQLPGAIYCHQSPTKNLGSFHFFFYSFF
jgi:hypothetical protein